MACQKTPQTSAVVKAVNIEIDPSLSPAEKFQKYWYQGKAEISSYKLEQARYGEIHKGDAVLIFVTEPFSEKKQVKLDYPDRSPKDAVSVLKCNFTRKFYTGIYPYSIMNSIFTPATVEAPSNPLKVTSSTQEWCGQTFAQLNLKGNKYRYQGYSYFESEGDVEEKLDKGELEDAVWNTIRINPESLPQGDIQMIPSLTHARLKHIELRPYTAKATLEDSGKEYTYSIDYPEIKRNLSITFNKAFPYQITYWEETVQSGYGPNAQTLTTKAGLNETIMTDYWTKNSIADAHLRKQLGID